VRRLAVSLVAWCVTLAVTASVAAAGDEGQGLWGETDDKVVTGAGFVLIAFFPLLVAVLSAVQWRLEKRRDARMRARQARSSRPEWRGGW
jgi:hypothetical protein